MTLIQKTSVLLLAVIALVGAPAAFADNANACCGQGASCCQQPASPCCQ